MTTMTVTRIISADEIDAAEGSGDCVGCCEAEGVGVGEGVGAGGNVGMGVIEGNVVAQSGNVTFTVVILKGAISG